jgi:hypothetical protein
MRLDDQVCVMINCEVLHFVQDDMAYAYRYFGPVIACQQELTNKKRPIYSRNESSSCFVNKRHLPRGNLPSLRLPSRIRVNFFA